MQETLFRAHHEAAGARLVDFAGWNMPVQYTSIVDEHHLVRTKCGLFDVSHMGRIFIAGPDHVKFTDHIGSNSRASMLKRQVRYNLICNKEGGIHDDVLITADALGKAGEGASCSKEAFEATPVNALLEGGTMIVCNAGNHPKIAAHIAEEAKNFDVWINDATGHMPMLALQGPASVAILDPHTDADLSKIKYYRSKVATVFGVENVVISRTGYTGEDGFELIFPNAHADLFWNGLLDAGKEHGLLPAGLGARDTLRLEAGMPLYGHEIEEDVSPIEAGLNWAIALDKDFIGKSQVAQMSTEGAPRKLVGLEVAGKRIARQHMKVLYEGNPIGEIASGTKSPTLDKLIATALIPTSVANATDTVEVEFKPGKTESAKIVDLPFYKRSK